MLTINGGKTCGECLVMAAESDEPVSTSPRTSPRIFARYGFAVCSERMFNARSSERPLLIMVANWRDMTARSLSLTFLPKPGMVSSRLHPGAVLLMLMGA